MDNVVINDPVFIAESAIIKNSVIGQKLQRYQEIGKLADAIIRNSIISSGAKIGRAILEDSIIGSNASVEGRYKQINLRRFFRNRFLNKKKLHYEMSTYYFESVWEGHPDKVCRPDFRRCIDAILAKMQKRVLRAKHLLQQGK